MTHGNRWFTYENSMLDIFPWQGMLLLHWAGPYAINHLDSCDHLWPFETLLFRHPEPPWNALHWQWNIMSWTSTCSWFWYHLGRFAKTIVDVGFSTVFMWIMDFQWFCNCHVLHAGHLGLSEKKLAAHSFPWFQQYLNMFKQFQDVYSLMLPTGYSHQLSLSQPRRDPRNNSVTLSGLPQWPSPSFHRLKRWNPGRWSGPIPYPMSPWKDYPSYGKSTVE